MAKTQRPGRGQDAVHISVSVSQDLDFYGRSPPESTGVAHVADRPTIDLISGLHDIMRDTRPPGKIPDVSAKLLQDTAQLLGRKAKFDVQDKLLEGDGKLCTLSGEVSLGDEVDRDRPSQRLLAFDKNPLNTFLLETRWEGGSVNFFEVRLRMFVTRDKTLGVLTVVLEGERVVDRRPHRPVDPKPAAPRLVDPKPAAPRLVDSKARALCGECGRPVRGF